MCMNNNVKQYSLIDLVAQSHLAIDFLAQFVAIKNTVPNASVADFYAAWQTKNKITPINGKTEIFTPAPILGHMYVSLVLVQQQLIDHMPSDTYACYDRQTWGDFRVHADPVLAAKDKLWKDNSWKTVGDLPLSYIIRRMRNSLAHGNFTVAKDWTFVFYDDRNFRSKLDVTQYEFSVVFDFDNLTLMFLPKLIQEISAALPKST